MRQGHLNPPSRPAPPGHSRSAHRIALPSCGCSGLESPGWLPRSGPRPPARFGWTGACLGWGGSGGVSAAGAEWEAGGCWPGWAAPTCPQPRCGALTHHPSGFLMSIPCPGPTGGLVSPPPPDCPSLCLGPEKGLTWEGLWLKPRSPPATAAVVASASSSSSRPGALQHPWQGLVSTWRHTGVSGAWSGGRQLQAQGR